MKRGEPPKRKTEMKRTGWPRPASGRPEPKQRSGFNQRRPTREQVALEEAAELARAQWRAQLAGLAGFGEPPEMGDGKAGQVSAAVRAIVRDRALWRCERCGRNVAGGGGQVHHRDPRGAGGSRLPELQRASNLVLLCLDCHARAESYRTEAETLGFVVRSGEVPVRDVPVRMWDGLWWLTDDGQKLTRPTPC